MAVRVLLLLTTLAVLYSCGQASSPVEEQEEPASADQAQFPGPRPEKPTLEIATLYVAGANGGPYKVSWTIWTPKGRVHHEFRGTGVIKEEPTAYHINLDGFQSDRDEGFFLGHDDIDMEATKTKPWEGELVIVLKVNDTLVDCGTTRNTHPRGSFAGVKFVDGVDLEFDADSRKDYKEEVVCADRLES